MSRLNRILALAAIVLASMVAMLVAPAFACTPTAALTSSRVSGPPGSHVTLTLTRFSPTGNPIEISWFESADMASGVLLTTVEPKASTTAVVFVPADASPGTVSYFAARQFDLEGRLITTRTVPFIIQPEENGYRTVAADGGVFAFGDAGFFGSTGGVALERPVVGMEATASGQGYWLVASDGGVFAFGDAGYFGSTGGMPLSAPIVAMSPTPSSQGYWLVASDGAVFAFGDASDAGDLGGSPLARPIVDMASTNTGEGYWLVDSDGVVSVFGDALPFGSTSGVQLRSPIVGMAGAPDVGYWLVAADGGIFALGDAGFFGSTGGVPLARPIVGLDATRPPDAGTVAPPPGPWTPPSSTTPPTYPLG